MTTPTPSGTVTFLFTDIEGSTKLLDEIGPDAYGQVLMDQRLILRAAFDEFSGTAIDTQGDSFFASFPRASEAVAAVVQIQRDLTAHDWPAGIEVRVRMGLHTGEPWLIEEGYVGMAVHRAARIAHVGHGGQVLLSETTTSLVQGELPEGVTLKDLGRHRLKDMRRPEHIQQLVIAGLPSDFQALTSLELIPTVTVGIDEMEARPPRVAGESPYRGLAAFREDDASFFFGRETFTDQLHEAIREGSLVAVVVGSSGSGKSSTVFAGLLPRLREEGDWLTLALRPGTHPFHSLATTLMPKLEPDLAETDQLFAVQKLADGLMTGEISLFHTIGRVLDNERGTNRILLILDQFEELYTLCPDPDVRQAFTNELLAAVESGAEMHPNPVAILVTLRADFMGQALTNRPFADAMQAGSLLLGPMNRNELQMAIEKPAELQGAAFEPGLVTRILDDVGEEPGNLPLLEFALTLLWDQIDQGWLTHDVYEEIGRVEGALARYADEFYAGLKPDEQAQARRIFIQLVQPGQGTEDTRRVARQADLVGVDWGLVQHLADKRLVVTGVDDGGEETVEVVHEALIRGWGQLRMWMAADREFRNWQEGLRAALEAWENSDRDEGGLLRGAPLTQAQEWLETRVDDIGETEKNYILASEAYSFARQQARERRRRLIIGGLTVGLVVAVLLSIFAFGQRSDAQQSAEQANRSAATAETEALARGTQQAIAEAERSRAEGETFARSTQQAIAELERERAEEEKSRAEQQAKLATSRELAAAALTSLEVDPERGILLALAALSHEYTAEAESALRQAVRVSHVRETFINTETGSRFLAASPDRERLFVSRDKGGTMWDIPTGEVVFTYLTPDETLIKQADFTPDGNLILLPGVSTDDDGKVIAGRITFIDAQSGQEVLSFNAHDDEIQEVAVSPDGNLYTTVSWDQTTKIWDLEATLREGEGQIIHDLCCLNTMDHDIFVSFSSDGTRLIIANGDASIWDPYSGSELLTIGPDIHVIAYSPDGDYLVSISWDRGILQVWDALTGERLSSSQVQDQSIPMDIEFSPDGSLVAIAQFSGLINLFQFSPEEMQLHQTLLGHDSRVGGLEFSLNGKHLFSSSVDGTTRIWDISPSGNAEIGALPGSDMVSNVIYDDERAAVIASSSSGNLRVLDADTLQEKFLFQTHQDGIYRMGLSPDGKMIATAGSDGLVKVLDAETLELLLEFKAHEPLSGFFHGVLDVDFSPDSAFLVTGGADGLVNLWDTNTGELVQNLVKQSDPVLPILRTVFHPTELWIATSYGGSIKIWGVTSGELLQELVHENWEDGGGGMWGLDFSPDGSRLITGRTDGAVEVWQLPLGDWQPGDEGAQLVQEIRTEADFILDTLFQPNGEMYAVSTLNGLIELRDPITKDLELSIQQPVGVRRIHFSPDGKRLYAVALDGSLQVYALDLQVLLDLAHSRVTRSLTPEECQTYLHLDECPD